MSRLTAPEPAPEVARPILETINAQMGFVPITFAAIAANPHVLEAATSLQNTLARTLDAKTRNSIALAVSQANGCDYCLAAHTFGSATLTGMTDEDITLGRTGSSTDPLNNVIDTDIDARFLAGAAA
jgi:AhpD family alkylhydroperoxidase